VRPPYVTRTGPVADAERDLIADLAEAGRSTKEIARRLGRDPGTVYYHRVVAGCPPPSASRDPSEVASDALLAMRRAGAGIREIGRAIGRPVSTVWLQLHRLAAQEH
jgi:IS30 family transposase